MPFKTKHYDLTAFLQGDIYLSSSDKRRFSIVDSQLWFLSTEIGDGVINGLDLTDNSNLDLNISRGLSIIGGVNTNIFGNLTATLQNNKKNYIYLQRKENFLGEVSAFSNVEFISYIDSLPPDTPTNLTLTNSDYNFIEFSWDDINLLDFDYYEIWRSSDNITFSYLDISETNSYKDEISLVQNSTYYYKIKTIDKNGLSSSFSSILTASTGPDTRIPSNPSNLEVTNGNGQIEVIWDLGELLVDTQELYIEEIDTEGIATGFNATYNLTDENFLIITDLENNHIYKITIKSVSYAGTYSSGISIIATPLESLAPQEFENFTLTETSIDDTGNVQLNLSWTLKDSEYLLPPDQFIITVSALGETGISSVYTNNNVEIINYTITGDEVKNIIENTSYRIEIQTSDGTNESAKYVLRKKTNKYTSPLPVTNLTVSTVFDRNTRSLISTWENSSSEFSYNSITIKKRAIGTLIWTNVILNENIKQSEKYSLNKLFIENDTEYSVSITTNDGFGNTSNQSTTAVISVELSDTYVIGGVVIDDILPLVPENLISYSGNNQVLLYWAPVNSEFIAYYKIWRANWKNTIHFAEDFSLVGTVPSSRRQFIDYTVENNKAYEYFITSVDIYGKESPNPDDGIVEYIYTTGEPKNNTTLNNPNEIALTQSNNSVTLSWDLDNEDFDGYEIWRSIENNYSWEYIDSVNNFATEYTDTDILAISGNYYYMIRKYRNEGNIISTTSKIVPFNSILLGIVTTQNNNITNIDTSQKIDLYKLRTPIRKEILSQFKDSPFVYTSQNNDKRIRLSDNFSVSDWTTEDYKEYSTEFDLRGTDNYYVYIDGKQSIYSTYIDVDLGKLYFNDKIFDENSGDTPPVVTVIFLNTSQVEDILKNKNISDNLYANKVTKGLLAENVVPQIDHFGRFKEKCYPEKTVVSNRINAFSFSDSLITGRTFYDILKTENGRYLASTSEGLLLSLTTDASRWSIVFTSTYPCSKLFYSNLYDMYFAIFGNIVAFSSDLENWITVSGLENVAIIRDIIEDDRNILISTDQGIFYFNPDEYTKDFWEAKPIVDNIDNSCFALTYSIDDGVLVSTKNGIWQSFDSGETWTKFSNITSQAYSFIKQDNYYFINTSHRIWRKGPYDSEFTIIASFDFEIRKIQIFNGYMFVTTDKGLLKSPRANITLSLDQFQYEDWDQFTYTDWDILDIESSIVSGTGFFEDSAVTFKNATDKLKENTLIQKVFNINIIDNRLWLCFDNKIYSMSTNNKFYLHSDDKSICPTIFIDSIERSVGVFYNIDKIIFDTEIKKESIVEVSKKYDTFYTTDGGWIDQKYDANLTLYINGIAQTAPDTVTSSGGFTTTTTTLIYPSTKASDISTFLQQISLPSFGARNSNFDDALKYYKLIVSQIDSIVTDADFFPNKEISSETILEIVNNINLFSLNIYDDVRSLIVIPEMTGTSTSSYGIIWKYNVVNGKISITGGLNKYSTVELSIKDALIINNGTLTHKEIEDTFENINSGLPLGFANIQQSNIIKLGIYNNILNPREQSNQKLTYQAKYLGSCDNALNNWDYSYDTEDGYSYDIWYDQLQSTVNYNLIVEKEPNQLKINGNLISGSFSIDYPNDICYISSINEVWVCGLGGIIAISTEEPYDISVILSSEFNFYNLSLDNGYIYALSSGGLYKININSKEATKDVDFVPPSETYSSILQFGESRYVSDDTGLYLIRPYEINWKKIIDINNSFVRQTQGLSFCIGEDINNSSNGLVYYSFAGVTWSRSNQFTDIKVNSIVQRGTYIYYATNQGLIVEDLSSLFSFGESENSSQFVFSDLNNDDEPDLIPINDVDSNNSYAIAVDYEGNLYKLKGSDIEDTQKSVFNTIHKVRIINNKYWLFSGNEIQIEDYDKLIQLSTGKKML